MIMPANEVRSRADKQYEKLCEKTRKKFFRILNRNLKRMIKKGNTYTSFDFYHKVFGDTFWRDVEEQLTNLGYTVSIITNYHREDKKNVTISC